MYNEIYVSKYDIKYNILLCNIKKFTFALNIYISYYYIFFYFLILIAYCKNIIRPILIFDTRKNRLKKFNNIKLRNKQKKKK